MLSAINSFKTSYIQRKNKKRCSDYAIAVGAYNPIQFPSTTTSFIDDQSEELYHYLKASLLKDLKLQNNHHHSQYVPDNNQAHLETRPTVPKPKPFTSRHKKIYILGDPAGRIKCSSKTLPINPKLIAEKAATVYSNPANHINTFKLDNCNMDYNNLKLVYLVDKQFGLSPSPYQKIDNFRYAEFYKNYPKNKKNSKKGKTHQSSENVKFNETANKRIYSIGSIIDPNLDSNPALYTCMKVKPILKSKVNRYYEQETKLAQECENIPFIHFVDLYNRKLDIKLKEDGMKKQLRQHKWIARANVKKGCQSKLF